MSTFNTSSLNTSNLKSQTSKQPQYTSRYHAQHLLAQYATHQIASLNLRSQDIVKAMGYPLKHTMPACDRLRHVLSNQYLALDGSYIDRYFTADAFLVKLFVVLDIPYALFVKEIVQIKCELAHYHRYERHLPYDDIVREHQRALEQTV